MTMIIKPLNCDLTYKSDDDRCFFKTFEVNNNYTLGVVQCFDNNGKIHQKIGVAEGLEFDVIREIMQSGADNLE